MKHILLLLFTITMTSCEVQRETTHVIEPKKFAAIYAELLEAAVRTRQSGTDSVSAAKNTEAVLARSETTREEFQVTVHWYNADVRRWKPFFEEVVKKLEENTKRGGNKQ